MATVKYALRTDRKQLVDVLSPIYGIATIVGSDGKKTEMRRDEFMELYEPVLPRIDPNLPGADLGRGLPNSSQQLSDILESLSDLHSKVDQIKAIVVPPEHQ